MLEWECSYVENQSDFFSAKQVPYLNHPQSYLNGAIEPTKTSKGIIQWRDVTQFLSQKCPTFLALPTFLTGSMGRFCWEMLQETPYRSFMGKNKRFLVDFKPIHRFSNVSHESKKGRPLLPTSRACHLQNTKETATVSEDSENSKCQKNEIE